MKGWMLVVLAGSFTLHTAVAGAQVAPQGAPGETQAAVIASPGPVYSPAAPAPAYGYPPPYGSPYGYPGGVVYAVPPRVRRTVVPYNGGPVPPGSHVERRPIYGLIAAGAPVFGVPYL